MLNCIMKLAKSESLQNFPGKVRLAALAALLPAALLGSVAVGQTNGTWQGQSGTWSTGTNWLGGNIADGGGIATFNNALGQTGNIAVTIDTTSRVLSEIRWDQGFAASIAASGGASIIMGPSGLTLNAINSSVNSSTSFQITGTVSAPITGSGDLVKIGNGTANISGANTFTGNVRINQGVMWVTDAALGNAANQVFLDGGAMGVSGAAFSSGRTFNIGANGATFNSFAATTLNGTLQGSGTLAAQNGGGLNLSGNVSLFTGALRADGGSVVTLNGGNALGGSNGVEVGGTLNLNNSTANVLNRLNGRSVTSVGGTINYTGSGTGGSSESAGNLSLSSGSSTITVTPGVGQSATLEFSGLSRLDRSTVLFRGTGLGNAPGSNVGNIRFTSSPGALIGSGGNPLSQTNASILAFAVGSQSATASTTTSANTLSFVTWDNVTQRMVTLDLAAGYRSNLFGAAADENINLAASEAVQVGGQTINSLRIGGAFTISGGAADVLTVSSGAILATPANNTTATISAPVAFGAAEGVISVYQDTTSPATVGTLAISGPISGTNGVTKSGTGILTLSGSNTYSGTTTLAQGQTRVGSGTIAAGSDGFFGNDASAINLLSSNASNTRLWTNGNLVINRDINVKLGAGVNPGIGTVGASTGGSSTDNVVINGNIVLNAVSPGSLQRFLAFEGGDTLAESITVNGNISGTGGLRGNFGSYTILSGNNSYSGDTLIGTSGFQTGAGNANQLILETWDVRSNTALGTGRVFFHNIGGTNPVSQTGLLAANGTAPVTLSNDIVLTNGFARFGGSQQLTLNGNLFVNGGTTNNSVITTTGTQPLVFNGTINGGGIIKNGAGTMVMNGANTYSGQTIVRQGVLEVSSIGNGGVIGNLGQAPSANNYIALSGNSVGNFGTLRYVGAGETTNRLFTIQGTGGTIDSSGAGALVFSNTGSIGSSFGSVNLSGVSLVANAGIVAISTSTAAQLVVGSTLGGTVPAGLTAGTTITEVGPNFIRLSATGTNAALTGQTLTFVLPTALTSRSLNLTGSNTGLNTMAPVIVNGANLNTSVNKSGSGTWQLTGANTYSGGTNVNAGLLAINNATGSGTGTGNVTVAATAILGGSGFIVPGAGNSVAIAGTVAPGNSSGTLTFGSGAQSTTVNLTGTYAFELSTAGTGGVAFDSGLSSPGLPHLNHDVLNVFGTLNLTGSTITLTSLGSTGFDFTQSYSWLVATTNGGTLTGLPNVGLISGIDFSSGPAGNFFLGSSGGNLFLNYQAIPEPGMAGFCLLAGLAALAGRRRRNPVSVG